MSILIPPIISSNNLEEAAITQALLKPLSAAERGLG
jgi:hypothetical protein